MPSQCKFCGESIGWGEETGKDGELHRFPLEKDGRTRHLCKHRRIKVYEYVAAFCPRKDCGQPFQGRVTITLTPDGKVLEKRFDVVE